MHVRVPLWLVREGAGKLRREESRAKAVKPSKLDASLDMNGHGCACLFKHHSLKGGVPKLPLNSGASGSASAVKRCTRSEASPGSRA